MKHLKLFFALFAMLALGVGNAWGAEAEVYSADFTSVATHSYTQNMTFTLNSKSWTSSVSQVNSKVFYLGCNSGNKAKGVLNDNSTFSEIVTALKSVDSKYSANVSTAHAYAMLFDNAYENVTKVSFGWAGGNNAFQVYLFGYSNSSWSLLKQTNYATSGTAAAGSVEWTGEATDYTKFAIVARPGTATSVASSKTLRASTFKIYATEDAGGTEDPTDCTPLTPTLSYESTTLLTSTTSSAPTLDGNTGNGTVTYTSSNKEVAKVNESGVITALKAGTATITATIESSGEYCEGKATVDITVKQLVSCADIYNLADDATFVLKDFVVTYANGKYTYIKDDTGYGLIYKESYGLKAGDQVASGTFEGKRDSYNGLVEIIPTTAAVDLHANNGTAPEPEPMVTNPTADDMNKYVKFKNVSFASTAFSSKSINGTIEGQGSSIKFYDQFATNKTFDTNKKYDVIGVVSMFNSVQVNFISAEEVAEPTLNLTTTPIDFGKVAINSTNESTLQLSGSLLTKDITLSVDGDSYFTVSANSITPSEGSVNETITITYKPTVEGTHTATLKITSDELTEQTISLQGQAVQQHTVHFFVNGEEQTDLAKQVLSGNTLEELPTATSCDLLNYPTFAGWASAEIDGTTDVKPTMLDLSTPITSECNYYAVFAKETTSSGSTTSAIMKYTGGTTTNMNDGNNATIVGLDETLFNITSTKTASGSYVGLNKNNDIRLYANKSDGNGNILTISMLDGSSITKITLDIKQEANFVVKANGKSITGADNVYTIDYPSCSIQNTTTGATTQLHLNSVTIEYTTSTTTYEYITSCAVVVQTCEITYDYADGEGECTNDIVEEGAEYTLCATAPTKAGHTFLKWKDQNGDEYEAGATINSVTEDLTLTAQWQVNSYSVTWKSLGDEVLVNNANYNTQPTKPATAPSYTCGIGSKEFVGWTTQEIDGVGVPANLYTDEFPVVTEPITYYAVFAGKSAEASITTNTLLVTEKLGNYTSGNMKDDQQSVWNYFAGGLEDGETLYLALRNKESETSYIESPKFTGTVQSIVAHVKNGSGSKVRTVYLRSSATAQPTEGDLGETSIPASNNSEVTLNITPSFDKFFIQVSDGLQFHKIVVTSGIAAGAYIDYITSCEAVTSSIAIEDVTMNVGDTHTITATITPAAAASAVSYTIKENATNAISLSGNTITALAEGTATITATIANATDYAGSSIDFKVTVDAAPVTSKVVILAQHAGQWYAMKAEKFNETSLNAIPVTYVNGTLYNVADSEKDAIEWERTTRGNTATFKKGENYLIGTTGTDLKLGDIAFEWAVDGNLYLCDDNKRTFIFNKGGYFKNYDKTNNSNGVAIDATYSSLPVVTAPVYATGDAYGRSVTLGEDGYRYGTICLPFGSTNFTGAEFFECVGKEEGKVYLGSVTTLVAGTPYIFLASATEVAVYGDGTTAATPVSKNGLVGTFEEIEVPNGMYILSNNAFCTNEPAGTLNKIRANRAYLNWNDITGGKPSPMPGRRYIGMGVHGENGTTGLDNIMTTDAPVKAIENGQLIIIRDGVKYNVQGQKL